MPLPDTLTEHWDKERDEGGLWITMNGRRVAKILVEPPEDEMVANVLVQAARLLTQAADER